MKIYLRSYYRLQPPGLGPNFKIQGPTEPRYFNLRDRPPKLKAISELDQPMPSAQTSGSLGRFKIQAVQAGPIEVRPARHISVWNSFAFSLFVVVISLRVGMKVGKGIDSIYFLTFHMLCPSAVVTNSCQCSAFALLILS